MLNLAYGEDEKRREKIGNPRKRTIARSEKKGYRGGARARERGERRERGRNAGDGGGWTKERNDDGGGKKTSKDVTPGRMKEKHEKVNASDRTRTRPEANATAAERRRGKAREGMKKRSRGNEETFEVVKTRDEDDTGDVDSGEREKSLTFDAKDWASLMKSAASRDVGSSARDVEEVDDDDGGDRARVFGKRAKTFTDCGLPPSLVKHLVENVGFAAPTTVQARTIPRLLAGRDVMVRAETGSGKTLSYIAPLFSEIGGITPRVTREGGTRGLILVPTRELATQVEDTARVIGRPYHWVVTSSVMGGENRTKEKARLRKGVVLLIATPGRLLDHLRMTESFVVDNLRWLVLDEADRLLDLGFEEALNAILGEISRRTENASLCTALLSATLTPGTARLAERMVDPVTIVIDPENDDLEIVGTGNDRDGDRNAGPATMDIDGLKRMANVMEGGSKIHMPEGLNHTVVEVSMKARLPALAGLLAGWMQGSISKAIVFFSSCESVEYHYKTLRWLAKGSKGKMDDDDDAAQGPYEIFRLHGLLAQSERTSVFRKFAETKSGVLLCTDVGARGLDFVGVGATVQVDPPNDATTYVHRVGRTARLGSNGEAVLFLQSKEREFRDVLAGEGVQFKQGSAVAMLNVLDDAKSATGHDRSMFKSMPHLHPAAQYMMKKLMAKVASDKPYNTLAKDAFRAYVRSYATFPSAVKHIFHIKRLHLGQVAAAFGLKDPPQLIGSSATKAALKAQKDAARKRVNSDGREKKRARVAKKARKLAPRAASSAPVGV